MALELLKDNIQKVPFLNLVKACTNAFEAIDAIQHNKIDLIFLDIQMPRLSGIQLAGIMQHKPIIIFLTAFQDYAIEAFSIGAVDYLLKPVPFERFLQASIKAFDFYKMKLLQSEGSQLPIQSDVLADVNIPTTDLTNVSGHFIYVYVEYSLIKIDTTSILYIEGLKDYVKIFLSNTSKPIITRLSMKLLEERLMPFGFLRTHRSYIVSVNSISSVQRSLISIGDKVLPVGENYRDVLMHTISKKNILNV